MAGRRRAHKKSRVARAAPAPDRAAQARRAMRLVTVAFLFVAYLYAVGIPAGKGPDETAHLRYIEHLATTHTLPVFDRENPGPDYEFHQPPLYYLIALPSYLLTARRGPEAAGQAVRFVTILLAVPLLYLTFALARSLAPSRPWVAPAAASVVAFLPMHLAISAAAGNDVLTEVFFAAAFLLMVNHLHASAQGAAAEAQQPSARTMAFVGLLVGLGVLTKSIAALLFPLAWAAAAVAARGPRGYDWRRAARDAAWATGIALAVCGWWLLRNQIIYGDPLLQRAFLSAFRDRPSPASFMEQFHLTALPYIGLVVSWTLASMLGVFGPVVGNQFVFYPAWVYFAFGILGILGAVGFARYLARGEPAAWQRRAWGLAGLLGALLMAGFIRFNLSFFQAQARYLFPALAPAAVAFCLGLQEIAPPRARPWAPAAAAVALLALAVVGLPQWIAPRFYSP